MKFVKYHGLGNDFILVDADREKGVPFRDIARAVCDRRRGIGADGLVTMRRQGDRIFEMRIYNADGSEAEMCGNATRCVARHIALPGEIELRTLAGIVRPLLLPDGMVQVDMGSPVVGESVILNGREGLEASMGNPHFVIFVPDADAVELEREGALLECHPRFPKRSNIEFAQILSRDEMRLRVWERGCGETPACGTGSCAAAVAGVVRGLSDRRVAVRLDGGVLCIEWDERNNHVRMTGPACRVFEGDCHV